MVLLVSAFGCGGEADGAAAAASTADFPGALFVGWFGVWSDVAGSGFATAKDFSAGMGSDFAGAEVGAGLTVGATDVIRELADDLAGRGEDGAAPMGDAAGAGGFAAELATASMETEAVEDRLSDFETLVAGDAPSGAARLVVLGEPVTETMAAAGVVKLGGPAGSRAKSVALSAVALVARGCREPCSGRFERASGAVPEGVKAMRSSPSAEPAAATGTCGVDGIPAGPGARAVVGE